MTNWLFRWLDGLFPHTHDPEKPCNHMKEMLSEMSDDSARGFKRWFTTNHVAGCPGCHKTLVNLREMRGRLRKMDPATTVPEDPTVPPFSPERRAAVEAAWAKLDEATAKG